MSFIFMHFILFSLGCLPLGLGLRASPDLKYANMAPSLVYQLISNGTEAKVLDKTAAVVSFAERSLSALLGSQKSASGSILEACEADYYSHACNGTEGMQAKLGQKVLKIRFLERNGSVLRESLAELANETEEFKEEIDKKVNRTEALLSQERSDLALIEQVEAMILDGVLNGSKADEFLASSISLISHHVEKRMKGEARSIQSQEVADEILNILSELKRKLNGEIDKLASRRAKKLSKRREEIEGFRSKSEDIEAKIRENEELLAAAEREKHELEEKIAGCQAKRGEKTRFCDQIRSNSTVFLTALADASALLREVEDLLQ